jgi:2-aminoethylphosphonate-pyruvate transaminase
MCFDLFEQWRGFERDGMFRFTPPTHAVLAFDRALQELDEEGGPTARARRYQENHRILVEGMLEIGFQAYIEPALQSPLVVTFRYPDHARFSFPAFHGALSERGFEIHPHKLSTADCFRIATLGQITPQDVRELLVAIREVLAEMGVEMRAAHEAAG